MLVEPFVLDCDHRLDERRTHVSEFDQFSVLFTVEHIELVTIGVVDDGAQRQFLEIDLDCCGLVGAVDLDDAGSKGGKREGNDDAAADDHRCEPDETDEPTHLDNGSGRSRETAVGVRR